MILVYRDFKLYQPENPGKGGTLKKLVPLYLQMGFRTAKENYYTEKLKV